MDNLKMNKIVCAAENFDGLNTFPVALDLCFYAMS
jgi:hypothetical protein